MFVCYDDVVVVVVIIDTHLVEFPILTIGWVNGYLSDVLKLKYPGNLFPLQKPIFKGWHLVLVVVVVVNSPSTITKTITVTDAAENKVKFSLLNLKFGK